MIETNTAFNCILMHEAISSKTHVERNMIALACVVGQIVEKRIRPTVREESLYIRVAMSDIGISLGILAGFLIHKYTGIGSCGGGFQATSGIVGYLWTDKIKNHVMDEVALADMNNGIETLLDRKQLRKYTWKIALIESAQYFMAGWSLQGIYSAVN